jgi:hypothetical protein
MNKLTKGGEVQIFDLFSVCKDYWGTGVDIRFEADTHLRKSV